MFFFNSDIDLPTLGHLGLLKVVIWSSSSDKHASNNVVLDPDDECTGMS